MRSSLQCLARPVRGVGLLGDASKASFLNSGTFWVPLIGKQPFPECNGGCQIAGVPKCRRFGWSFGSELPSTLQNIGICSNQGSGSQSLTHLHSWGEEKRLHLSVATFVPEKKLLEAMGIKCLIALLTSVLFAGLYTCRGCWLLTAKPSLLFLTAAVLCKSQAASLPGCS